MSTLQQLAGATGTAVMITIWPCRSQAFGPWRSFRAGSIRHGREVGVSRVLQWWPE